MSNNAIELNARLPDYAKELFKNSRYKVLYGGRGSGKTWTFIRLLIIKSLENKLLILCTRELQSTIADSVHAVIVDQIDRLGLTSYFKITKTEIRCTNGSKFIFKGLKHNVRDIKSLEGVDIVFVEEAEKCSHQSWEILIPTIRKESSEIWINFNPDLETDPTYQRFIINTPDNTIIKKVNYKDKYTVDHIHHLKS